MKKYEISEEDAQQIINYLSGCPFAHVYQLVQIMTNLKEIRKEYNQDDTGTAEEPGI